MGSLRKVNGAPVVVSEIVAKLIEGRSVFNSFPKVGSRSRIPVNLHIFATASIVVLTGKHETPGDAVALIEQYHLIVVEFHHRKHRVGKLSVAGDVGELCVGREFQEDFLTFHVKRVFGCLRLYVSHEVLTVVGVILREDRTTRIDIHRAAFTRIVGITTLLSKCNAVVIHAPVSLDIGLCTPPA